MSPGALAPISSTATSCSSVSASRLSGRPTWLFRLPVFFSTLYFVPSTAAVISFVVLFPFEPVMPTTGMPLLSLR